MKKVNPFAPPNADLSLHPAQFGPLRKPLSVWVVQLVGGLIAAACMVGLVRTGLRSIAGHDVAIFGVPAVLRLAAQAGFVALLLLMLWQLPKRSRLGRNLGLGLIAVFALPTVLILFSSAQKGEYALIGAMIAGIVLLSPLVYWGFAFAFSEKARRYFAATSKGGMSDC